MHHFSFLFIYFETFILKALIPFPQFYGNEIVYEINGVDKLNTETEELEIFKPDGKISKNKNH